MHFSLKLLLRNLLLIGGMLGLPATGWGQFRASPVAGNGRVAAAARTQAVANAGAARGAAAAIAYNPAYAGYGYPYGGDPYGGYLTGGASVIQAQGEFMVKNQEALLTKEQVKQAKLDTHRKQMDEYYYEKARRPTLEQEREETRLKELARAQNDPPLTEIWAGISLNNLLTNIQRAESMAGLRGPSVPLEPEVGKHVNVTTGKTTGSVSLVNSGNDLEWPLTLEDDRFEKDRKEIDRLVQEVVRQAQYNKVQSKTYSQLDRSVRTLRQNLKKGVNDIEPNDYIASVRYLNQLQDSLRVLKEPNVANYFSGAIAARGNTVAELVDNMTKDGLKFAPVTLGNEQYYTALHRSMVTYDSGLKGLVSR